MVNEKQSRVDQIYRDILDIDEWIDEMKQEALELREKQKSLQDLLDALAEQGITPTEGMK